jgi:hypothetical protein
MREDGERMRKPSLAKAMKPLDTKAPATVATPQLRQPVAVQPGRAGKKIIIGYFSPECRKQVKQLALDRDTTQQELLAEALNDLFTKYGKPTIA